MKPLIVICWVAAAGAAACNSTPAASTPPTSTVQVPASQHPSAEPERAAPDAIPAPTPEQPASPPDAGSTPFPVRDGGFGCAPFGPIKSQDPCKSASDCAPSSPCHARSCVAAANAPPKSPNVQCTMNLVCNSIDVGRCDCVDGVCALVSR